MGANKKLFGYYPTTPEWLPVKVDSAGKVVISNIPAHKTSHENGGSDEISVAGLSGLLADSQTPLAHKTSHQDGGTDEIDITGLAGLPTRLESKIITATKNMTESSGFVSYSGVGFTPTAIFCFAGIYGTFMASWGMADSAMASCQIEQEGSSGERFYEQDILISVVPSGGNQQIAIVHSYYNGGFILEWTKTGNPTGTALLKFLCFR